MIIIDRSALVQHPAETMYALVEDAEAYPQFLPWCSGAEFLERDPNHAIAALRVNFHGIRQRFATENRGTPGRSLELRLVSGPFRHLYGVWRFEPLAADACKVSLHLEYQMSNALLERVAGPVFEHIGNALVDAFVRRADALHPDP